MSAPKQGRLIPVPWAARLVMSAPKQGRLMPASGRDEQHDVNEGVTMRRDEDGVGNVGTSEGESLGAQRHCYDPALQEPMQADSMPLWRIDSKRLHMITIRDADGVSDDDDAGAED